MNILIINCTLASCENGVIPRLKSIKDCMICNFASGFAAQGDDVTIIASEEFRPTEHEEYPYKVIFMRSRFPAVFKPYVFQWPAQLRGYLRENIGSFDMVISSEAFSMATLLAAGICGSKMVIWQEMDRHQRTGFTLPSRLWYNTITRFVTTRALVVGRSIPARRFIARYASRVADEIVDHGANGDVLYPAEAADRAFIVVSQLVERKNVGSIIGKFADFISDGNYSDYRLDIVGRGDQEQALREQVARLGISQNVIFHGFMSHSELAALLRRARAMLIDTHSDLNMVSVPEAIVSGTPIVTNMAPTTAEYIRLKGLGIACDGWNAAHLREIAENYPRYHAACLAARGDLTREGCASKMKSIFARYNAK